MFVKENEIDFAADHIVMNEKGIQFFCIHLGYYPYENSQTFVVNYTLNYIYELPPSFLGGHELLIKKIKEGISDLVVQTRKIS